MDIEEHQEPLVIYESRDEIHKSSSSGNFGDNSDKSKGICNHIRLLAATTIIALTGILAFSGMSSPSIDLQYMKNRAMSLVQDVVYIQGDGYDLDPEKYNTLDADMLNRDDIAFCEGSFVYGVSPREADRGCVIVSHQDLFSEVIESRIAPYAHYCIGHDLDHLAVDFNMIKAAGVFKNVQAGYHSISQFSPGKDVEIVIFSGANFNGKSAVIRSAEEGRLTTKFYPDGTKANDNVKSFIIKSKSSDYFAGKDCGRNVQVCPVIITRKDAIGKQPQGCALFTTQDMGYDELPMDAEATGVRICANEDAKTVSVDKHALKSMKMVHEDGDKKSQISYVHKGSKTFVRTFETSKPHHGEEHISNDIVNGKYLDGHLVNDNVYSLTLKSTSNVVPSTC